ncbi:hypothetical protein [Glycomyces salinus]|uniref:hypothetical protein n=1 Tax=Glycomyces salinus TaxID=980294 RepID=UPI0018EC9F3F|nr:hypothetical protein [Glycomyces salinus]
MSPTFEEFPKFNKDYGKLDAGQRARFQRAVAQFVEDLKANRPLRAGLRVKKMQGCDGVYELTWDSDGRATWQYGEEQIEGEPHVMWRRIGTHDIFKNP